MQDTTYRPLCAPPQLPHTSRCMRIQDMHQGMHRTMHQGMQWGMLIYRMLERYLKIYRPQRMTTCQIRGSVHTPWGTSPAHGRPKRLKSALQKPQALPAAAPLWLWRLLRFRLALAGHAQETPLWCAAAPFCLESVGPDLTRGQVCSCEEPARGCARLRAFRCGRDREHGPVP